MGLAERFKDKLETKDIFKKNDIEQALNNQNIQFISKPVTENIIIQPKVIHSGQIKDIETIENLSDIKQEEIPQEWEINNSPKFEELETEIIDKIRKTPYWEDFSAERQQHMISKYFDNKTNKKYSNLNYSAEEKQIFIDNIIALSNNR